MNNREWANPFPPIEYTVELLTDSLQGKQRGKARIKSLKSKKSLPYRNVAQGRGETLRGQEEAITARKSPV